MDFDNAGNVVEEKFLMLKMATFYKKLPEDTIMGGLGQGGGNYWSNAVGVRLQIYLATALDAQLTMQSRPHGRDSYDRVDYEPKGVYDIAYCQLFESPLTRPADWIYSIISDYLGMEACVEEFLDKTRPNLMISFQYPLDPPDGRSNLVEQCANYGCKVKFMPWFNESNVPWMGFDRNIAAMCTGKMGGTYPWRDRIYKYLEGLNRPDVVLSGNPSGSVFPLSTADYQNSLQHCRYYVTGGIYDIQIPPKYYEVCNYGATLVSPELPMMEEAGFVDGETYIKIESLEEIPDIINSEAHRIVGPAGREMVQKRHSINARAEDIANAYKEDVQE